MANTGSNNRRKREGKKGTKRKPAQTKDLGSTTTVAAGDLTAEAGSPLALASEAHARETATAEAIAVVAAAMQSVAAVEAAPAAAAVEVVTPSAEVRERAGPQVRVKVSSGESRSTASHETPVEAEAGEVKVSRWLRDSAPKIVAAAAVTEVTPAAKPDAAPVVAKPDAAPAAARVSSKRVILPAYVDQPARRSTTWLWVFAAAVALVTWIMLDRPSSEHSAAAVAPPATPIAERGPEAPSAPTQPAPAPIAKATPAPAEPTKVSAKTEVAKVEVPVAKVEVAPAPPQTEVAPAPVVETPPQPVPTVTPTPEILALAERISADEPAKVEVGKRPARKVSVAPRGKGVSSPSKAAKRLPSNWYDEVPPKAADFKPRDYDEVMPLSGVRVADDESLSRGRQYDHVPPRAAMPTTE